MEEGRRERESGEELLSSVHTPHLIIVALYSLARIRLDCSPATPRLI